MTLVTLTVAPAPSAPRAAVVIVAAGRGLRAGGGLPKQYRMLQGKPVLAHTVAAFDAHPAVGEIVIVRNADDAAGLDACASRRRARCAS
jgi:2-C-methyl-D-erythritol 4-phosphate cytidylyltransferase/2-C-methyl-D-erythritol 2,4-cyclodiphosphate synthase